MPDTEDKKSKSQEDSTLKDYRVTIGTKDYAVKAKNAVEAGERARKLNREQKDSK